MGPLRFWISCLAWAFWRWDSFKQGALSVFAFVLLVLPFATGLSSLKEAVPVWGAVVPVGVLVLLVAPYVKFRESERLRQSLQRKFSEEDFWNEFNRYRQWVAKFMEYVRNMYERFAGDLEDELDDSLERAPHVSSFGYDEKLMDFARAIYPKTRRKYPKGFWQASDRAGLAIKVEEYEAFDGLRRDMGDAIDRWVRLSRDCGLWELLVATLREAPHEDVVKLLGYLEKARVDAMGHRTNLTRCGWWQLAEYWRSSSS